MIETSGAADPRPVAASLQKLCRLDLVVTVVDAGACQEQLSTHVGLAQATSADLILLNKCDTMPEDGLVAAEEALGLVTTAKVERCSHGKVPLTMLMDLSRQVQTNSGQDGFLSHEPPCAQVNYVVGGQPHFHNKSKHKGFDEHSGEHSDSHRDGITSVPFTSRKPLSMARWQRFVCRELVDKRVMRSKGILWFAERRKSR